MNDVSKKLVVTHVVSGDLWAGAEVQVYNLCRALKASDQIAPTAVIFNEGILFDKLKELGIPVSLVNEKKLGALTIARSIAAHCKMQDSKVVHTHGFKENVLGILGKELARVPISVRTVHGNPEIAFTFKRPHKWLVQKLDVILGRTRQHAVIAVSTQLEETLKKMFPGKVRKIFNFIDIEDIRSKWMRLPKRSGEPPRIGIVGRLVPVKRVDLFIRTIALLKKQGIICSGIIIGSGPLEKELKQLAVDLQVNETINFRGFVSPALAEIRNLDILLMTSDHEGLPMTLLEAMAVNVSIVAHDVGGIPEVLNDGQAGFLVKDHTPEGYASFIKTSLDLIHSNRNESAKEVPEVLTRKFSATNNVISYVNIYNHLNPEN